VAVVAAPRSLDAGAPMASTLDLCESICAAREQVKELSAKRDALKVEVEELKRQAAVRGLVVPP
jgi:cell division protein FtsB